MPPKEEEILFDGERMKNQKNEKIIAYEFTRTEALREYEGEEGEERVKKREEGGMGREGSL